MNLVSLRRVALASVGCVVGGVAMSAAHAGLFSNSTAGYRYFDGSNFVISAVQPGYRGPVDGNVSDQVSTAEPSATTSASKAETVTEGSFASQASATAMYKSLSISASNQGNPSISWPGAQAHAAWNDSITLTGGTGSAWWVCGVHVTGNLSATGSLGISRFGLKVFKDSAIIDDSGVDADAYQKFLVLNGGSSAIRNDVIKFSWSGQGVYYGASLTAGSADPADNVGSFQLDKDVFFVVPFTYGQQFSLGFRTGGEVGERVSSGDTSANTAAFSVGIAWNGKGYVLPSLTDSTQSTSFSLSSGSGQDWAVSAAAVPEPSTWAMGAGGLALVAWMPLRRRKRQPMSRRFATTASLALVAALVITGAARAEVTIDWVTVGNPGNANDSMGYGAVGYSYQIGKYEVTNSQYAAFLNAVATTDTYSLYNASMGSDGRGGIVQIGEPGGYTYELKAYMGDKPVNYVSWFSAARFANWLHNGQGSGGTETGAYTLVGGQTSGVAPAKNPGAQFYLPTQNEWYKAAYYKGGSSNAGYWSYPTQSNLLPVAVTAGFSGIGSAGSTGNFANFEDSADWNGQDGNVTTVGTNGGPGAYGTFDMAGNVNEWTDSNGAANTHRNFHGASFSSTGYDAASAFNTVGDNSVLASTATDEIGFRLASPTAVPEPSTWVMAMGGLACAAVGALRRRTRA